MPRSGRPRNDLIHSMVSRALSTWLRMCLAKPSSELNAWLRNRPDKLGGMLPRDADRFLFGESIPSTEKLKALEEVAPGLVEISTWPWRALDPERNGEKALTNWEAVVAGSAASEPPAFPASVAKNPTEAEANAHAWKMARRFFNTAVSLRRATIDRAYPDTCTCAFRLIKDYGNALVHPAIFDQEQEIFQLVRHLVLERFECAPHTALLLSECARRHGLDAKD